MYRWWLLYHNYHKNSHNLPNYDDNANHINTNGNDIDYNDNASDALVITITTTTAMMSTSTRTKNKKRPKKIRQNNNKKQQKRNPEHKLPRDSTLNSFTNPTYYSYDVIGQGMTSSTSRAIWDVPQLFASSAMCMNITLSSLLLNNNVINLECCHVN